jgi:hypothetical protein
MKAIQLSQPQSFQRVDIRELTAPGPGQALVRIPSAGIVKLELSRKGSLLAAIGASPCSPAATPKDGNSPTTTLTT